MLRHRKVVARACCLFQAWGPLGLSIAGACASKHGVWFLFLSCALFAVCFRWGLGAFLFLSSHVEILTSHDARYTAVAHLPPARLGGVSSLDPLGSAASRLAPLPLRQPPLLPAPPLLVSCLAAPLAPGHQSSCESLALHTLTTQQLRRESVKVKILLCRPSRHSSCVVRV